MFRRSIYPDSKIIFSNSIFSGTVQKSIFIFDFSINSLFHKIKKYLFRFNSSIYQNPSFYISDNDIFFCYSFIYLFPGVYCFSDIPIISRFSDSGNMIYIDSILILSRAYRQRYYIMQYAQYNSIILLCQLCNSYKAAKIKKYFSKRAWQPASSAI